LALKIWVEISEENLAGNLRVIQEAAGPETEVLAVVKANAYGHGIEVCSVALVRAGARWLGVTCANEGAQVRRALRAAGIGQVEGEIPEILVMCGVLPEDLAKIQEHGLTPVVWTEEQVQWLTGTRLRVHVEIDTGMGRQGVCTGEALDALLAEVQAAGLTLDGLMTHFCSSEVAGSQLTQLQERRFETAVAQVRSKEITPTWIHAGNTSTVDNPAQANPWLVERAASVGARAMVRTGLALYGHCLPIDGPGAQPHIARALQPVIRWKTSVLAVRALAAGDTVGYGATFTAPSAMLIALLPVGYADGLRRELSSTNEKPGGWVMLHGRRAAILGRISMNLTIVDVTGIDGVAAGDAAVLLGDGITPEDHANLAGTIPYEILCAVRER
jgi:alanine racemase